MVRHLKIKNKEVKYNFDKRSIPALIIFFVLVVIGIFMFFYWRSTRDFSKEKEKTIISATIFPVYDIIKNIVGSDEDFLVYLIAAKQSDPSNYTPDIVDDEIIKNSDIIYRIGAGYDDWLDNYVNKKDIKVADLSTIIELEKSKRESTFDEYKNLCETNSGRWLSDYLECEGLPKDECMSNGGSFNNCASACRYNPSVMCVQVCIPVCSFKNLSILDVSSDNLNEYNPYYWLSIDAAKKISENIYYELKSLKQEDSTNLDTNYNQYVENLDELKTSIEGKIYNWDVSEIYTLGINYNYFVKDFNINTINLSYKLTGDYSETNANELEKIIDKYKITTIYIDNIDTSAVLDDLESKGKIKVCELDSLGRNEETESYIDVITKVSDILTEGCK